MSFRIRLFRVKDPYGEKESEELFWRAVRENCAYQYANCKEYRSILDQLGFHPDAIWSIRDIASIPFLPTLLFKKHELYSMPKYRMPVRATSSGTKGSYSRIGMDMGSLFCGLCMVWKVAAKRKLLTFLPAHYCILGYKPHRGNQTAVTKTAVGATFFTPALSRTYALIYRDKGYVPDLERIAEAVVKYSRSPFPVRFMGFPSYTYFLLQMMEERGICVRLKKGSKIMLGGGWKQHYTQEVDKQVLYGLARKVLGIEEEDIVEFFGAVEHPVLYCDCKNHHFHIPAYSRVIIRDVHTFEPLEIGKTGLVNLITPLVKATPIVSVMTDDLGVIHDKEICGCGIKTPYLEIVGRIGLKDIKTCAEGAAEVLEGMVML